MKILYFNIFLYKNGKKTDYPISELFDFISKGNPLQRTRKLDDDKVIFLSKSRYPVVGRDSSMSRAGHEFINNNRTTWIGKFNADKPYTGAIGSDDIEQITGDLYQPNVCLAISDSYLFLMEYNFLGPSKRQIEKFLTTYIVGNKKDHDEETDHFEVRLNEIKKERMLNLIPSSKSVRSVTITVKNEGFELGNLLTEVQTENSLWSKLIQGPVEASKEMEVNQTTVTLKKGRRKKEMDIAEIGNILNLININSAHLVSAVVEFVNPRTGKLEKFDLKHDGSYTGFIETEDYTGFEILADLMTKHYYDDNHRSKDTYYHNYLNEGIEKFGKNSFKLEYPQNEFDQQNSDS
ncbi:hypothetical protein [Enterococcus casseliflavus]|uniref:hypothetical protein n=1 Tax=Enterococcus casseliflavus TaxID=37734 RepID=UPI0022E98B87|nr:hypothetical protein [Enterococcus casseliflavus]